MTLIGAPVPALGEQPLEALQRGIDKGISVLADPQYQDASRKKEQAQKLWEITLEIFSSLLGCSSLFSSPFPPQIGSEFPSSLPGF